MEHGRLETGAFLWVLDAETPEEERPTGLTWPQATGLVAWLGAGQRGDAVALGQPFAVREAALLVEGPLPLGVVPLTLAPPTSDADEVLEDAWWRCLSSEPVLRPAEAAAVLLCAYDEDSVPELELLRPGAALLQGRWRELRQRLELERARSKLPRRAGVDLDRWRDRLAKVKSLLEADVLVLASPAPRGRLDLRTTAGAVTVVQQAPSRARPLVQALE